MDPCKDDRGCAGRRKCRGCDLRFGRKNLQGGQQYRRKQQYPYMESGQLVEEAVADSCGRGCDHGDLCSDKWNCKSDRTGTDPAFGDHTTGENAEKAMVE